MAQNAPYIVADSRETFVHPFLRGAGVACVQRQIQVGDYLICRATDAEPDTLAVFERKTWKDFAASILDGRAANLGKMLEFRARTGCKLFYILEGPAFPSPRKRFQRVPFARIQAAVTELSVFHGVFVVQTLDQRHTATRLNEFAEAFQRASERDEADKIAGGASVPPPLASPEAAAAQNRKNFVLRRPGPPEGRADCAAASCGPERPSPPPAPQTPAVSARAVPLLATKMHEKNTADIAVEAWARLRGVSLVLGKLLSEKYSFASFVRGGVATELDRIKTANGKALGRSARASLDRLRCGTRAEALRVLAGVPGVGPATAGALLDACGGSFARLLSFDAGALGIITCGAGPQGPKKLGATKAARLHAALHFSGELWGPPVGGNTPQPKKLGTGPGPHDGPPGAIPPSSFSRFGSPAATPGPAVAGPRTPAPRAPGKTEDLPDNGCQLDDALFFELLGLEPPGA